MQPPQRALLRKPVQPAPRPSGAVLVHRQIALADRDTCYLPRIDGSREIPYDILTPAVLVSRSVIGQGVLLREKTVLRSQFPLYGITMVLPSVK